MDRNDPFSHFGAVVNPIPYSGSLYRHPARQILALCGEIARSPAYAIPSTTDINTPAALPPLRNYVSTCHLLQFTVDFLNTAKFTHTVADLEKIREAVKNITLVQPVTVDADEAATRAWAARVARHISIIAGMKIASRPSEAASAAAVIIRI